MKAKITLKMMIFALILSFNAHSQVQDDTIRTVIISEFHEGIPYAYLELTNVGDFTVNLKDFEVGRIIWKWAYSPEPNAFLRLPDFELKPDSSYLLAHVFDYARNIGKPITPKEYWEEADLEVHFDEGIKGTDDDGLDSISPGYHQLFHATGGNSAVYLRYHVGEDSVVVDGVRHIFSNGSTGSNQPTNPEPKVVAGVANATGNSVLIRKTSVTQGNTDWTASRGTGPEDSEWIVVPMRQRTGGYGNKYFTTLGHHGEAQIAGSIESDIITIDIPNKKMEVPWGIYGDSIMNEINVTGKGIAWHYISSPFYEDSTRTVVVTNDSLSVYAVGAKVERIDFALVQVAPANDMALVFPKRIKNVADNGWVSWSTPFYVTQNQPGMDSIGNIPFATRVDTLLKYIEKAPEASWEIVWVDETERADLKVGDILKVTAENGTTTKAYYLAVESVPDLSHNAYLSAITWPDLPEAMRRNPAWKGDTIPTFSSSKTFYSIELPYGTAQVPALIAISQDLNAKIKTERALRVHGSIADRTTTITVTAEDDTTTLIYKVEFYVEKPDSKVQPFLAEPIISQFGAGRGGNRYFEITNPGTKPLDLSNYMICATRDLNNANNPAEVIQYGSLSNAFHFLRRFSNIIPGYTYKNETIEEWALDSGIMITDLRVNPIIGPGNSFLIGRIENYGGATYDITSKMSIIWTNAANAALFEQNRELWGIENVPIITVQFWAGIPGWNPHTSEFALYKIVNDSIHDGTKAIGNADDFELLDFFGSFGGFWSPGADTLKKFNPVHNIRKPGIYKPNPGIGTAGSWADTDEESEWEYFYSERLLLEGYTSAQISQMLETGWGYHVMDPITVFKSTVTSQVYNVSDGFETPQDIQGVVTGTTVAQFLSYIMKEDEGQTLTLIGRQSDEALVNGDTLAVTSADGINVTKYILGVTNEGLPSNAVLTAVTGSGYTIEINGETGSISGVLLNSTITDVLKKVTKPSSAKLNIVNKAGDLVPLQVRGFDGEYRKTIASNNIYFEVIAGNHVTKITYQLKLKINDDEAYAFSNVYDVDQSANYVSGIPGGTNVETLLRLLFPNEGASIVVVDKNGMLREIGDLKYDDQAIVTSPDGTVSKIYRLQFNEEPLGNDAYVVSDIFDVDDSQMLISNIPSGTGLAIFMSLVQPAPGANIVILDASGNAKNSGTLLEDDQVQVTSASGMVTVIYNIVFITSVHTNSVSEITIYPNPVNDLLNVEGLKENSIIVIRNIVGVTVKMVDSKGLECISVPVNELSSGIYFITVITENRQLKAEKFIKR